MFRVLAIITFLSAAIACAQSKPEIAWNEDGNIVTTPAQLHRASPPDPNASVEDLEKIGDELRSEKNFADALDYFSAAIAKQPSARLYNKRGMAKVGMMLLGEAKKDFEKAIKLDKKYPEAENNLGAMLYYHDRNYRGAIKHYKKAIALEPRANFYSNLGTAYFGRKDYDKAEDSYKVALQLDPDVFERAHSRTAMQLVANTREERARHDYVIARIYALNGDSERCLLYLQKALEDGFNVAENVKKDKVFAGLLNDPRLKEMLAAKPLNIN
jgi:tetratricopeptide (TPR) repeat protein